MSFISDGESALPGLKENARIPTGAATEWVASDLNSVRAALLDLRDEVRNQAGVFYVRHYGAVGDGVHDDLPAFREAVAAAYAWAQQYSFGAPTSGGGVPGAKVVTGSGYFRLVGNLDLTLGDPLGGGPTYEGMGRITLEGMGRANTQLVFENGTLIDGLTVGSYTSVTDMTIRGAARTMVKSAPVVGTGFVGRSAERLYMRRVFITGLPDTANNYVSLDLPGVFWATLDTVYAPYGLKMGAGPSGHNCYGVTLLNCQIANYAVNTTPSLTLHGSLFQIIGGLIYSVNPSSTPSILLEEGTMVVNGVDFGYTGVSSSVGYDIVVGGGNTFGSATAIISGCNLSERVRTIGSSGHIYVRSNTVGGEIGQNSYQGAAAPAIDIEAGAEGLSINDTLLSKSDITYDGGADLSSYTGNILVKDAALIRGLVTSSGNPLGRKVAVPATATSTGTPGDFAADASYFYICTATDTWRRADSSSW